MQDIRCGQCSRKLAEIAGSFELQIKCPRCRMLNYIRIERSQAEFRREVKPDVPAVNNLMQLMVV